MIRKFGLRSDGLSFDEKIINAVWRKGKIIWGDDPDHKRKDIYGTVIRKDKYGEIIENGEGWEIDHIKPVSKGGTDDLANLQPLQWQNNRKKGDSYLE
ncbi:MAG: HNH endonuclease [Elusimicrobia bacterium]|nr:HNH endonuclease [Elusimicrobiota bacterium]